MGESKNNRALCIVFGLIFSGMAAVSLYTGHAWLRKSPAVSEKDNPITFWTFVGVQVFAAIWLFYNAVIGGKRE